MKLRATLNGFERVLRTVRHLGHASAQAAGMAAADALSVEIERTKEVDAISAPLIRMRSGNRHSIGIEDAAAVERELGSLTNEPSPWLAPVLPAARGPMRAAAAAGVRELLAGHAGRRKSVAAARAISSRGKS